MRVVCWISKVTDTHSENVKIVAFTHKKGYANAPQYYAIRTLPILFYLPSLLYIGVLREVVVGFCNLTESSQVLPDIY